MLGETAVAQSDYVRLVSQGILDAKGSIEEALALLTADDLTSLGRMLAERAARIGDMFSAVVEPINSIATAIEKGNYASVYDWISDDHTRIPLTEAVGSKRIYFVPVTENVYVGEEEAYVKKFGLTLCKQAPNYLIGAMAALPEHKIPAELKGKDFVAADNNSASVFQDKDDDHCFLYVYRSDGERKLYLVLFYGHWEGDDDWVFLAEKP